MSSIEIFKTSVAQKQDAQRIVEEITVHFPQYNVNFDLEDCDKILRVESAKEKIEISSIVRLLESKQIECKILN